MARSSGSWWIAAALLLAVALSAVGLYAWRARGAWLRTPLGRVHYCVQMEGGPVRAQDLEVYLYLLRSKVELMSIPGLDLEVVRAEPSTAFRSGYLQFAWVRGDGEKEWKTFKSMLPQGGLRGDPIGCRMAWVDSRGEVVRLEP